MGNGLQQSAKIDDTTEVGMEGICDYKHFTSLSYLFTYDKKNIYSFISIKVISNK